MKKKFAAILSSIIVVPMLLFMFGNVVKADINEDLLLNKAVTYSDVEGGKVNGSWKYPQFVGENVVDGNPDKRWSAGQTDNQWLIVDIGKVETISQIVINFYAMSPDYTIEISEDGVNYQTVYQYSDPNSKASGGIKEVKTIELNDEKARYIKYQQNKMWKHTNGKSYGSSIIEIEAYSKPLEITDLIISPQNITLTQGRKKQLTYEVKPNTKPVDPKNIIWTSSDDTIVSIDEIGQVTALKEGSATITARLKDTDIMDTTTIKIEPENPEYNLMLARWKTRLLGGAITNQDLDIQAYIASIDKESTTLWDTLDKSDSRTYLWKKSAADTTSADYTTQFNHIKTLTLAYYMDGTTLHQNKEVKNEILKAISFMIDTKKYNGSYWIGNWWDWQIGSAQPLTDTLILLHDDLVVENYDLLEKFVDPLTKYASDPSLQWPKYTATGANLTDISLTVLGTGILLQDDSKIALVEEKVPTVLKRVVSGDGIYADGSLVQHNYFPYNGSYGNELLKGVARVQSILVATPWEIKSANMDNLFNVVEKGYLDMMSSGRMPSMVSGRSISRAPGTNPFTTELETGKETIANLLLIAKFAPDKLTTQIKSTVKNWVIEVGDKFNFYQNPRDFEALNDLKQLATDSTIVANENKNTLHLYTAMDRVLQKKAGYTVGISMYSKRMANFESINTENKKGWHTSDGMLYLYNNDFDQFDTGYFATVDPYRLPGTTVDTRELADGTNASKRSPSSWVGGSTDQQVAAVGMDLNKINEGMDLTAKKSWFLLNDRIVNLGAGITGTTNASIEQIIENREVQPDVQVSQGNSENYQWINLNQSTGNIGYIIPNRMKDINVAKETNSGTYKNINGLFYTEDIYTKDYVKILKNYGNSPTDESYEYVVIPNQTNESITRSSSDIGYEVLANTGKIQAIKTAQYTMANVWEANETLDNIHFDTPGSFIIQPIAFGKYKITIANPKQDNATVSVTLGQNILSTDTKDQEISIHDRTISLDSNRLYGESKSVIVNVEETGPNKEALNQLILEASELLETDYTSESWANFSEELVKAQNIQDNKEATQTEVDKVYASLSTAINELVKMANKNELAKLIQESETLDKDHYTTESWAKLVTVRSAATETLANENASQTEVDSAVNELKNAIDSLVEVSRADKSELQKLYDQNVAKQNIGYTQNSWLVFEEALSTAKAILENEFTSQDAVDTAYVFLESAINNLTVQSDGNATFPEADTTELKKLIEEYGSLKAEDYTEKSWNVFQTALTAANTVVANPRVDQKVVDANQAALKSAFDSLEKVTTPFILMYRVYNPNSGEHLYTSSMSEVDYIVALGWRAEGIAWKAPVAGNPVYRVYNPNSGEHFYTLDQSEYNHLQSLGWKAEGTAFYSSKQKQTAIYRLYNPNAKSAGSHHFTINFAEAMSLKSLGWRFEGTAFYGE